MNIQTRDKLVLEHIGLAKTMAIDLHGQLPVHTDLDDLIHSGILGLFDATKRFKDDKGVAFGSYARHRIRGAMLDSLRQLDWASRDMRRWKKKLEAASRELSLELQRKPTEVEVANYLGIDMDRWRRLMVDLRAVGLMSASTRQDEDQPPPDHPCLPSLGPEYIARRLQMNELVKTATRTLPDRYQKVLKGYYVRELSMKEIGKELGINESRVSQIHKTCMERLRVIMQTTGINAVADVLGTN